MVSSLWPPVVLGGAELYASSLAEHLRSAGKEVGVVTMGVPGPDVVVELPPRPYRVDAYADQPIHSRVAFHLLDVHRPETTRAIRTAIRSFRPDVIHTHSVVGLSGAALSIANRPGVGHVHSIHDYWLLCRRASLMKRGGGVCEVRCASCRAVSFARNRALMRRPPDSVLANSEAVATEHDGIPWVKDRVRVALYPQAGTRRPPRNATEPVFGYLGRLTREKGVATLVRAFADANLPATARLVVGGLGPLYEELARTLPPRVELVGWLEGAVKETFLEDIDCLVVPSEWKEPAGIVINEAHVRGIPVIAARIGGIPELVAPSSRPLLFRPGDRADLADKLGRFATAPEDFRLRDDEGPPDWDSHLALVMDAYETAQRRARSRA